MRTKEELQGAIDRMERTLLKLTVPILIGLVVLLASLLLHIWIDNEIVIKIFESGLLIFIVSFIFFGIVRGTQRSLISELENLTDNEKNTTK